MIVWAQRYTAVVRSLSTSDFNAKQKKPQVIQANKYKQLAFVRQDSNESVEPYYSYIQKGTG